MTKNDKTALIKEYSGAAIAALNSILDSIYELNEKFFDEAGQLIDGLTPDEKLEGFIKELKEDSTKYESLRRKLLDGDFNLSLAETARVGLSFMFMSKVLEKQIGEMQEAKNKADEMFANLIDSESEIIDFSKE